MSPEKFLLHAKCQFLTLKLKKKMKNLELNDWDLVHLILSSTYQCATIQKHINQGFPMGYQITYYKMFL